MEDDCVAILEAQLAQAKLIAEEADKKYEEVVRKLAMVETDLERAEGRAETGESKIVELEEVSEEKASKKEESFSTQLRTLTAKCKEVSNQHHSPVQALTENTNPTTERPVDVLLIIDHLSPHLFLTGVLALTVT